MAVGLGEANALLALLCRPAEVVRRALPLPRGVHVWGIDSGNAHSVGGGDYGATRAAAVELCRAAAAASGRERLNAKDDAAKAVFSVTETPLTALVTPTEFDTLIGSSWLDCKNRSTSSARPLPPLGERVRAAAFLKRYPEGHGDDGVTAPIPRRRTT